MVCLPLIERELRVALRKQRPVQGRLMVAAVAVAASMLLLLLAAISGDRGVGQTMERFLCVAGLCFVLQVPILTAGVLAEERRNQTLGLLFLSGLGAGEVFASKFLSSALIAFTNLLAIFPMLALPFLIGGISYDLFIAIICALPALMLFVLSVSLLASALARDETTALVLAGVLGALLCLLPPAIYLAQCHLSSTGNSSLWWLRLSPAYGPYLIWRGLGSGFHAGESAECWQNLALTLMWSALALGGAALTLKRVWREQENEAGTGAWRKWWREFAHGGRESRRRLGRAWLDENPFVWLYGRDWNPAMLCWLVAGGIVLAWLSCWAVWRAEWISVMNFMITAALLNSVLALLTRHAAAQAVGQGRRDGDYELLLTTPLTPAEIVHGTLESLRWRFRAVGNFILTLNALLMLWGLTSRQWTRGALFVYLSLWLFLLTWSWSLGRRWARVLPVMWASLNCGRPAYAVWRSLYVGPSGASRWWYWVWIYNLYTFHIFRQGFGQFPTGTVFELVLASSCLVFWLGWLVASGVAKRGAHPIYEWDGRAKVWNAGRSYNSRGNERVCERRLISEFREIVREPLPERNDPRFKKWNAYERFPWGFRPADSTPTYRSYPNLYHPAVVRADGPADRTYQSYPNPVEEEAKAIEGVLVELARSGYKNDAVKLARQTYGFTLEQAVAFVEKLDGKAS
jgi:ABC-type transport system involved in multi-copper enzyme maturation permease subunit